MYIISDVNISFFMNIYKTLTYVVNEGSKGAKFQQQLSVIRVATLAYPSKHARAVMHTLKHKLVNINANSGHVCIYIY